MMRHVVLSFQFYADEMTKTLEFHVTVWGFFSPVISFIREKFKKGRRERERNNAVFLCILQLKQLCFHLSFCIFYIIHVGAEKHLSEI